MKVKSNKKFPPVTFDPTSAQRYQPLKMDRCQILGVPVLSLFKQELCLLVRKRWIRRCFCALAVFVVASSVLIWWLLWHAWLITHSCTDVSSREYLNELVNVLLSL